MTNANRGKPLHRFPAWFAPAGAVLLVVQAVTAIVVLATDDEPARAGQVNDGKVEITYIATGNLPSGAVQHRTPYGTESHSAVPLPFRTTIRFDKDDHVDLSVRAGTDDAGKVMCTIIADGRIVKQSSASGRYETASCSGSIRTMEPVPGAKLPSLAKATGPKLPGEARLTQVVRVKRYKGKGSPVKGRVADEDARLSFAELGGEWNRSRRTDPMLEGFGRKQQFYSESRWLAVISSGVVDGDLTAKATGKPRLRAVASGVQDERQRLGFPDGTRGRDIASQPIKVSGRQAWVIVREMHFQKPTVKAKMDLSAVVVVDTGRPNPSFLWVDVPETHKRLWSDVNTLIASLRVTRA